MILTQSPNFHGARRPPSYANDRAAGPSRHRCRRRSLGRGAPRATPRRASPAPVRWSRSTDIRRRPTARSRHLAGDAPPDQRTGSGLVGFQSVNFIRFRWSPTPCTTPQPRPNPTRPVRSAVSSCAACWERAPARWSGNRIQTI